MNSVWQDIATIIMGPLIIIHGGCRPTLIRGWQTYGEAFYASV